MKVKELIEELKKLPQDLPIRTINPTVNDDIPNQWVYDIEVSTTNLIGYEVGGEVRLLTSE